MMVAAVDQRDLDRRAGEAEGGFQPAKTGADDHHAMGFCPALSSWGYDLGFRLGCSHCIM